MFRFMFVMLLYVTVARWIYSEISLVVPSAVPAINECLNRLQIPTHDKWDKAAIERLVKSAEQGLQTTSKRSDRSAPEALPSSSNDEEIVRF